VKEAAIFGLIVAIAILGVMNQESKLSEFSPPSSTGMQCVALEGTGLYCRPKIMNDEVQRWFERQEKPE